MWMCMQCMHWWIAHYWFIHIISPAFLVLFFALINQLAWRWIFMEKSIYLVCSLYSLIIPFPCTLPDCNCTPISISFENVCGFSASMLSSYFITQEFIFAQFIFRLRFYGYLSMCEAFVCVNVTHANIANFHLIFLLLVQIEHLKWFIFDIVQISSRKIALNICRSLNVSPQVEFRLHFTSILQQYSH